MINSLELIRQRLALQVVGAKVNIMAAQQSAQKLQPHLPPPDLRAWITPPENGVYPPSLLPANGGECFCWFWFWFGKDCLETLEQHENHNERAHQEPNDLRWSNPISITCTALISP